MEERNKVRAFAPFEEDVMKVLATLLSSAILCSTVAFSQDAAYASARAACGPKAEKMKVSAENAKDLVTQPEPGKALVCD